MAVKKNNQKMLVKKLKKQVKKLQSRETKARNKLRTVLKKLRKQGTSFKRKLTIKARELQAQLADAQASAYAKLAVDLERQLIKSIRSKGKALAVVVAKLEKKHLSKLKNKNIKSKTSYKRKKSTKNVSRMKRRVY